MRPPKWEARRGISIHSPHARGDRDSLRRNRRQRYFNPLPSCEGRRFEPTEVSRRYAFQSTPLMRGETGATPKGGARRGISIHSPHARGDRIGWTIWPDRGHFNPLPSCEGRRFQGYATRADINISIHSPHARGDQIVRIEHSAPKISIHSPHARGDGLHQQKCEKS